MYIQSGYVAWAYIVRTCSPLIDCTVGVLPDTVLKSLITEMAYVQDMEGVWQMQAAAPGHELLLRIGVQHREYGTYFQAILKAKRVVGVRDPEAYTWLMPHKVAFWIYWQVWHCLSCS